MNSLASALSPGITSLIRMDHAHVLSVFHQYTIGASPSAKQALVRSAVPDNPVLAKSVPEHDEMRGLIAELRRMDPSDAAYDQTFMELMREVIHHVADEETVLLPEAERIMPERLSELGAQMTKRRLELAAPHAGELAMNSFQAASASTMLFAAGAMMAGTYLVKRAFSRHA
jgi:hypothetical protein